MRNVHNGGRSGSLGRVSGWLACSFLVGLCVARPVHAQDGLLTGGALSVTGNASVTAPRWTVVGNAISAVATGGDAGNPGGSSCSPCTAGDVITMSGTFTGNTLGSGTAVVNGTLYSSPVFFDGVVRFTADPAVMPDFDGNSWMNVTVPFTLSDDSFVNGWADAARTMLLFRMPVSGQGTATLHLLQFTDPGSGNQLYQFRSVTYTFTAAPPAANPKPPIQEAGAKGSRNNNYYK